MARSRCQRSPQWIWRCGISRARSPICRFISCCGASEHVMVYSHATGAIIRKPWMPSRNTRIRASKPFALNADSGNEVGVWGVEGRGLRTGDQRLAGRTVHGPPRSTLTMCRSCSRPFGKNSASISTCRRCSSSVDADRGGTPGQVGRGLSPLRLKIRDTGGKSGGLPSGSASIPSRRSRLA